MSQQIRVGDETKANLDFLEKKYGELFKGSYDKKVSYLEWFYNTYSPIIEEIQNNGSTKHQ